MKTRMSRREFMVKTSSTILGAGLAARAGLAVEEAAMGPGRGVEVYHAGAVLEGRKVDGAVVAKMLRSGLRKLTGTDRPWADFLKPGDRVGLKINCLGQRMLFTHRELIQSIVDDLKAFGIRENDIIVWERWQHHLTNCGFKLNMSDKGVRYFGTEGRGVSVRKIDPEVVYVSELDNALEREDGTASRFSSIFTKECDKIINMAILKDHNTSGYTMCLKNLAFGVSDNNTRFHKSDYIGPFIAGFCAHPEVRKKVVLHIVDALEACYDQGPVPENPRVIWAPKTIWLGTDPVALDAVGYKAIDAKRVEMGLPLLKDSPAYDKGMRPVDHVGLAAAKGLGVRDLAKIKIDRIELS